MHYFLILTSFVCFAVNSAVTRAFQIKYPGERAKLKLFQSCNCFVSALLFMSSGLINAQNSGMISIGNPTALIIAGLLFGVFFFISTWGSALGCEIGSMSLASIIFNMSLSIPIIYSCVVLGEKLDTIRIIGIALIVLTLIMYQFQ